MGNVIYSEFFFFFSVFKNFYNKPYICIKIGRKSDQTNDIIIICRPFSLKGFKKTCKGVIFLYPNLIYIYLIPMILHAGQTPLPVVRKTLQSGKGDNNRIKVISI